MRTRIQSRHKGNTLYNCYITYSKTENCVKDTFCSCKSGKRTVGTCSHCTSIIYYLSNGRYNTNKKGTYNIEKIFPQHTLRKSSDESDNNSATEIDTEATEIESDATEIEDNPANTLYPDLSEFHHY